MMTRQPVITALRILVTVMIFTTPTRSQPYIDPIQVRYTYGFRQPNTDATPFAHLWAGSDLPVRLGHDRLLLISPSYEMWDLDSADAAGLYPPVHSLTLPIGLILPIGESRWTITFIPMVRTNGEKLFAEKTFQAAGVILAAFARRPQQKIRFGVYVSGEFFGLFVIPLLGVDWRIDDKNYLFGVLPGRLTFEHKWSDKFYVGATFRAPTNSYRLSNGGFIRLDDNQASLFLDYYPIRQVCLTLEPGLGVFRRLRIGGTGQDYVREANWGDGIFIKLSAAYRIRLD